MLAGGLLFTAAALLPFRAAASERMSLAHPFALAVSRPLTGVVTWPQSRPAFHEPGVLLVAGSSLVGLGVWLRRATARATTRSRPRRDVDPQPHCGVCSQFGLRSSRR